MRRALPPLIVLVLSVGLWVGASSTRVKSWWADLTGPKLPAAENATQVIANTITAPLNLNVANANIVVVAPLPAEKNLAVPFTSQAPHANWDNDHQEFCEEASVLMVGRFFRNQPITSADDAEAALQRIKQWEIEHLGFYYDTTAAETAEVAAGVYDLKVELFEEPTIDDIKRAVASGRLVILPAAGRELGNPNFTPPGPIYHNLVIRGYTKDGKFITNDPGTRKGEAYVYDQAVVMAAIHDWVPAGERTIRANGDSTGRKVALIVSPS